MLRSIYLKDEINHFKLDFIVEDPVHGQVGTNAVEAKVCFLHPSFFIATYYNHFIFVG